VQQRESAPAVADRVMAAVLYGPRHPYGFTELGTESSVKAIGRGDMQAFWKQSFVPNNAALVVVGAIARTELKALAEKTFGGWQPGTPSRRPLGEPATRAARLVLVDKPGAPQTQLRVATIGASRSTPDFPAVETMNTTLGGMFSSRININLREVHGYTYGANSRFVFRRGAGPFLVSSGIRTDVTAPAVTEILKEIGRMMEAPVTGDELALAKGRLMLSLPSEFETSDRAAAGISNLYIYDLGLDYYARSPGRVASVDGAAVQSVARKYLVPAKMIVVAVGDRAKIEPELNKLNLGPIEILDTEGNVKAQGATR
jgi:zinc protease